jgi:hypothetical protein
MQKKDLQRYIAETAYNVGFGAKKHFATYDMAEKIPGILTFLAMAIGIFGLVYDGLNAKPISATLLVFGLIDFYLSQYKDDDRNNYASKGTQLTEMFNQLKALYFEVSSKPDTELPQYAERVKEIEANFYSQAAPRQMLFSDWYAHYKFFWQHQIGWIEKELKFTFWRDKVPLSFLGTVGPGLIAACFALVRSCGSQ